MKKKLADPVTAQDAIAIFDLSAARTRENHQTKAWKILRTELQRLSEYEQVAGIFAIEKAELRRATAIASLATAAEEGEVMPCLGCDSMQCSATDAIDGLRSLTAPAPRGGVTEAMVPCRHEVYHGACVHCDVPFVNGRPKYPPAAQAQDAGVKSNNAAIREHLRDDDRGSDAWWDRVHEKARALAAKEAK